MENQNILEVHGLCKKYKKFALEQVDLVLPKGCIMGFVEKTEPVRLRR